MKLFQQNLVQLCLIISCFLMISCEKEEIESSEIANEEFMGIILDVIYSNFDKNLTLEDLKPIFENLTAKYGKRIEYSRPDLSSVALRTIDNGICWTWFGQEQETELIVYNRDGLYCHLYITTCDGAFEDAHLTCN